MSVEIRSLTNTVVAVTGASSGIGRETARLLVDRGAKVALTARRRERLDELVEELGAENVVVVDGDISLPATSTALVAAAENCFGRLDSVVACAGVGAYGGVTDGDDDQLQAMMDANYAGTVWAVRSAIPAMRRSGGGDIVVVASVAGHRGGGNEAVYAGSKAAQLVFAGAVDREVRTEGIRVSTISPAAVSTEFAIGSGREAGDPWLDEVMRAEDVAAAIVFTLQQPRRLRTTQWSLWAAAEAS